MSDHDARDCQEALLKAMRAFVRDHGDDTVKRLAGPLLGDTPGRVDVPPRSHPAVPYLPEMRHTLLPKAGALFDALMAASPSLAWQVSYSTADGFSEDYIRRYAWCDVMGPEGVYLSDGYRIGFGFWRRGLFYPPHEHGPEEIYWVIGGTGTFTSGDNGPVEKGPGSIVHHEPWVRHSIHMRDSPMLVLFLWQGEHLHRRSNFRDAPG